MGDALPATNGPLILFDGVCNLCNAAVRWVIERDPRGKFRFASLQSQAGRAALAAAGAPSGLPDSIVFIHRGRVLTESDAAIAIAERIGGLWTLFVLAQVIPRALRDPLYRWVARNRYRWFGRQNACTMPTPELRNRFLDADEPRRALSDPPIPSDIGKPEQGAHAAPNSWRTAPGALMHRFILAYLFLYSFPFPLGWIPYTGSPAGWYDSLKQSAVVFVGKALFGLDITVAITGSGDTTYNYVEVFTYAVIALLLALVMTLVRRGAPVGARVRDLMSIYVRYTLGVTLLSYGWNKVIPLQMPFPGPERLMEPFGDASPMGLLWAFIGASPAYQAFAGLGEVLGGSLLLFRRTSFAGALLSAGVLLNVVMLNFCYDVPVKLYSCHLLFMALFLIAPHWPRLGALLFFNLPAQPVNLRPFPIRRRWIFWPLLAAKLAFIGLVAVYPVIPNLSYLKSDGMLAPTKPWHGVFRVESFNRDGVADRALPDAQRWVRVGINSMGIGAIQRADGSSLRQRMAFDESAGTVTITRRDEPTPMVLKFSMPDPSQIVLEGVFEGKPITAILKRTDDVQPLLINRGFHWINEYPLNR